MFTQLLHMARSTNVADEWIEFTPYSMLKALERGTSGSDKYQRLQDQILRLKANLLCIYENVRDGENSGHKLYGASLIRDFTYEESRNFKMWRVRLEPAIVLLFSEDTYSLIYWEQRKALRNNALAKWLHSFYSTHGKPYPLKVETIHRLCKSGNTNLFSFRQHLESSLHELLHAGFLKEARIDDKDLVHVARA